MELPPDCDRKAPPLKRLSPKRPFRCRARGRCPVPNLPVLCLLSLFSQLDDHWLLFQPDFTACLKNIDKGGFLAVQCLGLQAFTAKGVGSIPGWGSEIPQAMLEGNKKEYRQGAVKEKDSPTLPSHLRGAFHIHFFPQSLCVPRTKRQRENCQLYGPKQNHPSSKDNRRGHDTKTVLAMQQCWGLGSWGCRLEKPSPGKDIKLTKGGGIMGGPGGKGAGAAGGRGPDSGTDC